MYSRRRSTVLFGASSLILCALTLLNCSRTPKFKAANAPSPAAPAPTAPLDNPSPSVNGTGSSNGGNVSANNANNANSGQTVPQSLVGAWQSECIAPDTYEPDVKELAQAKNIRLNYSFGANGSYTKSVTAYSDATCQTSMGPPPISDSGNFRMGLVLSTASLPAGTTIEFAPNSGAKHEFTTFVTDPSLRMSSPILNNPYTAQNGLTTITFTQTGSSSASGS